MSPDLAPGPATTPTKRPKPDRRAHRRYQIALDLRYKLISRRQFAFVGRTCDVSSGGILFRADEEFQADEPVQLSIHWPFLLEGRCPLQLVILGHVVRSDASGTAVRTQRYQYRTLGISSLRESLPGGRVSAVA